MFHEVGCYAQRSPWSRTVEFLLIEKHGDVSSVGVNVQMEQINPENLGVQREPTFRLSYEAAQVLMDELWNCGLRPTEGAGSAGALAATQRHLEDMRKLVFKEQYKP